MYADGAMEMAGGGECCGHDLVMELEKNAADANARLATRFVRMTIDLGGTGVELRHHIETQLSAYGEPLRWAITAVDGAMAHVEAVVTVVADAQP